MVLFAFCVQYEYESVCVICTIFCYSSDFGVCYHFSILHTFCETLRKRERGRERWRECENMFLYSHVNGWHFILKCFTRRQCLYMSSKSFWQCKSANDNECSCCYAHTKSSILLWRTHTHRQHNHAHRTVQLHEKPKAKHKHFGFFVFAFWRFC